LTVIGVDIGNRGAIALIDESGELVDISDMPWLADGPKGRPTVHAPLLAAIVAKSGAARAYVEWVGPRPTDGSVGAFAFGYAKRRERRRFGRWRRSCDLPDAAQAGNGSSASRRARPGRTTRPGARRSAAGPARRRCSAAAATMEGPKRR
jgi:hypothetical protein